MCDEMVCKSNLVVWMRMEPFFTSSFTFLIVFKGTTNNNFLLKVLFNEKLSSFTPKSTSRDLYI